MDNDTRRILVNIYRSIEERGTFDDTSGAVYYEALDLLREALEEDGSLIDDSLTEAAQELLED